MNPTYLDQCLKNDLTVRWPEAAMPLKVYIAPFNWYEASKQHEAYHYRHMVLEALKTWSDLSNQAVRFKVVNNVKDSLIDLKWRRVDRRSLGHCEYRVNQQSLIYSAEIQIGISDGLVHSQYNHSEEVRHTILHEFGHALGLVGHSDDANDIMYVPHQYGITGVSSRDAETLRLLYRLPVGFSVHLAAQQLGLSGRDYNFQDVLDAIEAHYKPVQPQSLDKNAVASGDSNTRSLWQNTLQNVHSTPATIANDSNHTLDAQHDILSQRGQFYVATQNIPLSSQLKKALINKPPL
jgi:predicted Zn-dependent protease